LTPKGKTVHKYTITTGSSKHKKKEEETGKFSKIEKFQFFHAAPTMRTYQ
jgi:hypothetical protein